MKLKPGAADEYKRRHDEVWPEVVTILRQHGFSDFSIFLDEQTSTLFAVFQPLSVTVTSNETLRSYEVMRRWWTYMDELVEFKQDETPDTNPLKIVFHMD